jgi:hypothetical protein
MMDEAAHVLQVIRDELDRQAPDEVRPLALSEDSLSVLDGKIRLHVVVHHDPDAHPSVAHCHVIADIGNQSGCLDACITGIHSDRREALADAAKIWVETAAGPTLSLVHCRPVMGAAHFEGTEPWGVSGCHGFVGPVRFRLMDRKVDFGDVEDARLFAYASEMAPPGMLHLVKVTLEATGSGGWNRSLEVDGHLACHAERPWKTTLPAPSQGIASQFAVFHYADQPGHIEARQRLDDAIRRFVSAFKTTEDTDQAADVLKREGVEASLAHEVHEFTPLAFGRVIVQQLGVSCSPYYTQVKSDGTFEKKLPLMRQRSFARSMALFWELMGTDLADAAKQIAMCSPELNAVNTLLNRGSNATDLVLTDPILPDAGVSQSAFEQALRGLKDQAKKAPTPANALKPWWKFW